MIKVFGHTSPDTDATGAAIVWAWYLSTHHNQPATAYVQGALNSETAFVLKHWGVAAPALLEPLTTEDQVVVVDTNNIQELPESIADASILQIIDHHKLIPGLSTDTPIDVTIRPVACTATIMYDLMGEAVAELPREIAGLMLSCILSDTLEFRSPTTTDHDKEVATALASQLNTNISTLAGEMFAAKSDLSGFTDLELVTLDSKKYPVGDKNIRISVLETTDPASVLARQEGILTAIDETLATEADVDDVLFFIIDILKEEATVLTYNDLTMAITAASFAVTTENDTTVLPGIVSRKKQIIPVLTLG